MGKKKTSASPEKKVILFMSVMSPQAKEKDYLCPDGKKVQGTQTNEAPVKYLLRKYREKITKILCVVSAACRENIKGRDYSTLDYFRREIERFLRDEGLPFSDGFLTEIDFQEDGGIDAEADLARAVSREINPGDEILLETTGGFRNSVMLLLLLSKTLSYTGHPTAEAVYSFFDRTNAGKDRVYDVSDLTGLFDLIGGMEELRGFGNVNALRAYYEKRPHDEKIDALLSATKNLLDTITLCRTRRIPDAMRDFNDAMSAAETCQDSFLPQLLPAFRQKYGERMNIPGLIRWCLNSDMLQQALTIYKENIPDYLIKQRKDVLEVKPHASLPSDTPSYQSDSEAHFRRFAASFYRDAIRGDSRNWYGGQYADYNVLCPFEAMSRIALDYNYILLLRNMVNHASDAVEKGNENKARQLHECRYQYPLPDEITAQDVKKAILQGLENMKPENMKE